jgi:hypothetical protein
MRYKKVWPGVGLVKDADELVTLHHFLLQKPLRG